MKQPSLIAICLLVVSAALFNFSMDPTPRPNLSQNDSCKPSAPIELKLQQLDSSFGRRVDLAVSVMPLRNLDSLSWELELPEDVKLIRGLRATIVDKRTQHATQDTIELDIPTDEKYRRVRLIARGSFYYTDSTTGNVLSSPLEVSKTISWGTPPHQAALMPIKHTPAKKQGGK